MISIRHARVDEKHKTYTWLCLSDTASMHMGAPDYPEAPIPTWDEFNEDFDEFYYQEEARDKGSVMIIEQDGEEIGCVCYACFHLKPQKAELDIWLKEQKYCGYGNGTQALEQMCEYLQLQYNINAYIIRPSIKNLRAVRAYEKVGFKKVEAQNKAKIVKEFIRSEYLEEFGAGDYGFDGTQVLIKKIKEQ